MQASALRRTVVPLGVALVLSGFGVRSAHAQLFVSDYKTGATLGAVGDDVTSDIALTHPVWFYGVRYSSLSMSTNGNLNFAQNSDFRSPRFPTDVGGPSIAPLWSDWFTASDPDEAAMYYREDADKFVATWDVRLTDDPDIQGLFQAVLYPDGKIAFGFDSLDPRYANYDGDNPNITGLNAGDGMRHTGGELPNEVMGPTQICYIFDGIRYVTVPEPGFLALLGAGILCLGGFTFRRKT